MGRMERDQTVHMIYRDGLNAELSPAYDIVTTKAYIADESKPALNMAKARIYPGAFRKRATMLAICSSITSMVPLAFRAWGWPAV